MKRGRDGEKLVGPLFPRLHINDTEKGGPRAPPRNKMALYEQFSVPSSQRLSSGSASVSPLLPNSLGNVVPSSSSSQGGGHSSTLFSLFFNPPTSPHLDEGLHSSSSSGLNLNSTTLMNLEWPQPMEPTTSQNLTAMSHLCMSAKGSLFQPHNFSNTKNSSVGKQHGDEEDFSVPIFIESGKNPSVCYNQSNTDNEKVSTTSLKSSRHFQTVLEKQPKQTCNADFNSKEILWNQTPEQAEKPASNSLAGDEVLVDASSTGEKISDPGKNHVYVNHEKRIGFVDGFHKSQNFSESHQSNALRENKVLACSTPMNPEKSTHKRISSTVEGSSYSRPSLGNNHKSPQSKENSTKCSLDRECGPLQVENIDKIEDLPKTSIVDSISGLNISPDDVVGVIGQKQFWKARRTIVHQQRVFAVQVFELHRIIKVQRLIAASPNLLLEDDVYMGKSTTPVSVSKKPPFEFVPEPRALVVKPKEDFLRPNICPEFTAELALGTPPVSSLNADSCKGLLAKNSIDKAYSGSPPPVSVAADKPPPWYFHPPPGNQWLIPIMSPSEGLIYKPCSGPCPPTSGFMAPVYGSCTPIGLNPQSGDFVNTAYAIPGPHQQRVGVIPGTPPIGQTFFPPYGMMPIMNNPPSASESAVEQKTPLGKIWSNGQENKVSAGGVSFPLPHQSSFNISSWKSGNMSFCVKNSQVSKESEVQASTASSPPEKVQGDVLPLFPTAPTARDSDEPSESRCSERQSQVIKVVPHNPRLASESVARIFQSIQEERKRYDQIISRTENACN